MQIDINEITDALENVSNEREFYYGIKEAHIYEIMEDSVDGIVNPKKCEDISMSLENYIPLPKSQEINEYKIMQYFIYEIDDEKLQDELLHVIQGAGAFKRFREAITEKKMKSVWHRYRREALYDLAIKWCVDNNIEYHM